MPMPVERDDPTLKMHIEAASMGLVMSAIMRTKRNAWTCISLLAAVGAHQQHECDVLLMLTQLCDRRVGPPSEITLSFLAKPRPARARVIKCKRGRFRNLGNDDQITGFSNCTLGS